MAQSERKEQGSPLFPTPQRALTISPPHPYHLSLGEVWGTFKELLFLGRNF
jgi:hypothetical protein